MNLRFVTPLVIVVVLVVLSTFVGGDSPAMAQTGAPSTGNIVVRDGPILGEVVISWDAVPATTHYRIGYVNMETDYPLAKASNTGNWLEAFVYVDVEAQNFTVVGGRAEYTIRRLEQGVRHAFTVRTGNSPHGDYTWPSLDFTQNLEEATDAITLGRRHSWLESEGFSLSAANADVQELPATLYH